MTYCEGNGKWNKDKIWINNGEESQRIDPGMPIPRGWKLGRGKWRKPIKYPPRPYLELIYNGMINRCYNSKDISYQNYGGRGITVCDRWKNSFSDFMTDVHDEIGRRPDGRTPSGKRSEYVFDRVGNEKGYQPGNIKWSTWTESNYNKRDNRLTLEDRKKIEELLREEKMTYKEINEMFKTTTAQQIAKRIGVAQPRKRAKVKRIKPPRFSKEQIIEALIISQGNLVKTCKVLNLSGYDSLNRWLKKYNINWRLYFVPTEENTEKMFLANQRLKGKYD